MTFVDGSLGMSVVSSSGGGSTGRMAVRKNEDGGHDFEYTVADDGPIESPSMLVEEGILVCTWRHEAGRHGRIHHASTSRAAFC